MRLFAGSSKYLTGWYKVVSLFVLALCPFERSGSLYNHGRSKNRRLGGTTQAAGTDMGGIVATLITTNKLTTYNSSKWCSNMLCNSELRIIRLYNSKLCSSKHCSSRLCSSRRLVNRLPSSNRKTLLSLQIRISKLTTQRRQQRRLTPIAYLDKDLVCPAYHLARLCLIKCMVSTQLKLRY